ncbi:MAG: hypothetical protein HZC43_12070 [Nitrosomonadales bacterium]|nr:hypothetical protein [Nitrosomonadales bacterium]
MHIGDFDQGDAINNSGIGSFEFDDGSTLTTGELLGRGFDLDGTNLDDTLTGTNTTDRINGLGGNGTLIRWPRLIGLADCIHGQDKGGERQVYFASQAMRKEGGAMNFGMGAGTAVDAQGGVIRLAAGLDVSGLLAARLGDDLRLRINGAPL